MPQCLKGKEVRRRRKIPFLLLIKVKKHLLRLKLQHQIFLQSEEVEDLAYLQLEEEAMDSLL